MLHMSAKTNNNINTTAAIFDTQWGKIQDKQLSAPFSFQLNWLLHIILLYSVFNNKDNKQQRGKTDLFLWSIVPILP